MMLRLRNLFLLVCVAVAAYARAGGEGDFPKAEKVWIDARFVQQVEGRGYENSMLLFPIEGF